MEGFTDTVKTEKQSIISALEIKLLLKQGPGCKLGVRAL